MVMMMRLFTSYEPWVKIQPQIGSLKHTYPEFTLKGVNLFFFIVPAFQYLLLILTPSVGIRVFGEADYVIICLVIMYAFAILANATHSLLSVNLKLDLTSIFIYYTKPHRNVIVNTAVATAPCSTPSTIYGIAIHTLNRWTLSTDKLIYINN
ncbi:hypothetical protein F4804DRAFT_256412 [Jackrogersella minutella]|nr:hypothetical protein F4804DRAFT_256412 [Jackrogersella minutella]